MLRPTLALIVLITSTAAYGQSQTQSALSPGRPADVKRAGIVSVDTENTIILTGSALIIGGIAFYLANHGTTSASPAPATTTSP
jgi:hypothetical protein